MEPVVQVPSMSQDQMIDGGRRRPSAALGDILSQWRTSPRTEGQTLSLTLSEAEAFL